MKNHVYKRKQVTQTVVFCRLSSTGVLRPAIPREAMKLHGTLNHVLSVCVLNTCRVNKNTNQTLKGRYTQCSP